MADVRSFTRPHLDEATFERLALDEVGAGERAVLFDHITACPSCSRIWRGLVELRGDAENENLIPRAVPVAPSWRSRGVALALAATLVAVISGVVLSRRTVNEAVTLRSGEAVSVGDVSATAGGDGRPAFSWAPVAAATRYRVNVFSDDGQVVWTREVAAPPLSWPVEVPRVAGAYRWQVEALADNAVVARSRLVELEVAR